MTRSAAKFSCLAARRVAFQRLANVTATSTMTKSKVKAATINLGAYARSVDTIKPQSSAPRHRAFWFPQKIAAKICIPAFVPLDSRASLALDKQSTTKTRRQQGRDNGHNDNLSDAKASCICFPENDQPGPSGP